MHCCQRIKTLTLPDSLLSIGKYGFSNIRGVTSITLPATLNAIDEYAFYGCQRLVDVRFLGTANTIGSYAFGSCEQLDSIAIFANTINPYVVDKCPNLRSLRISGNNIVNPEAISNCPRLKDLYIDVKTVGDGKSSIFTNCDSITNLIFGDNVVTVETKSCTLVRLLKTLYFGTGITAIRQGAFKDSPYLTSVIFASAPEPDPVITVYGSESTITFATNTGCLIELGNRVRTIQDYAFTNGTFDLGSTVQSIGKYNNIVTDVIPASVNTIAERGVKSFRVVEYSPTALTWTNSYTTSAHNYGYPVRGNSPIINRTIVVKDLANGFTNPNENRLIYASGNIEFGIDADGGPITINRILMSFSTGSSIHIGPKVKTINTNAMYEDAAYTQRKEPMSVVIDEGIETLSALSIVGTRVGTVESLTLPGSLKSFSAAAIMINLYKQVNFSSGQGDLNFATNPEYRGVFYNTESLYIDRNITGCTSGINANTLTHVTYGEHVNKVADNMFKDCNSLEYVILSDSIDSIGASAFENCKGLKILTMSERLKNIGDNAYTGCTNFERIVARGTIPPSGNFGFDSDIEANIPLYVPNKSLDAYKDSDLFYFFDHINPFGEDVATDVVVDEETPEAQEYVDALDESEPGTTVELPSGGISVIVQPIYEEDYNEIPKANVKAASARAAAPELYWVSLDPTVASVDQQGNVTINKKAPVEIRAYLLDGSDKYASFGVNQPALLGDLNRDKVVNTADLNAMINHVAAPEGSTVKLKVADMNGDGEINAADINIHINQCVTTE